MTNRSRRGGFLGSIFGRQRSAASSRRRQRGRPQARGVERLEPRALLATFTVTSNADSGAGVFTPGELRWAIDEANNLPGLDTIEFRLPDGSTTISLLDGLESITDPLILDGTTQPGYLTSPIVAIDGTAVADVGFRVTAAAGGTTIRALSVYGFLYTAPNPDSGNAIVIDGSSDGNEISGCFIGTDATSAAGIGNAVAGVLVRGTNTSILRSVISGNGASGVILENDDATVLEGNRIGTVGSGDAALANAAHGVLLLGSSNARIGGTTAAVRNVISGNDGDGIRLDGATFTSVVGNYVGVDAATGAVAVANGGSGISIDATDTLIGDGTVAGRNVVGGNDADGILIRDGSATRIVGNFVGAAAGGTVGVGNVLVGIRVAGGSGHVIGGTAAGEGNVVADNGGDGVRVTNEASDVLIQQNLVGLGVTLFALPNGGDGVSLIETSGVVVTFRNRIAFNQGAGVRLTSASGNRVGADVSRPAEEQGLGFGNAIYANELDGIRMEAEANDNVVAANLVGLATPNGAIQGNGGAGIAVQASRRNTVGGELGSPVFANVVAGNAVGISITDSDALDYLAAGGDGNAVIGNEVRNNAGDGIVVDNASFQTIGGPIFAAANTLTLNGGDGIVVRNGSRSIAVAGNHVGTNAAGVVGFGNGGIGIHVQDSNATVIGGEDLVDGNLVVGNGTDGIVVARTDGSGDARENRVFGNTVRANLGHGIRLTNASDNLVGSADPGYGNAVGNNALDGLRIELGADSNVVLGNVFGGPDVLGNGGVGVRVVASFENVIGDSVSGAGNSISRNAGGGLVVAQSQAVDLRNGNVVVGNTIDSNLGHGMQVVASSFQTIGGAVGLPGAGNTVTRNRGAGIRILEDLTVADPGADENLIQSNFVGTDSLSASGLGNFGNGVEIVRGNHNVALGNTVKANQGVGIRVDGGFDGKAGAAAFNVIGGAGAGQGNVVVGNLADGIVIQGDARSNSVLGGLVLENKGSGIAVRGSALTRIGGGVSVGSSTADGILVGTEQFGGLPRGSAGTVIEDAFVGTNTAGGVLGNQGNGIRLSGVIGVSVADGVVSAFNRLAGVRIEKSAAASLAAGNVVRGAEIRENLGNGIVVSESVFQSIGGITDGFGNVVEENVGDGIVLTGMSRSISVQGNTVSSNSRHGVSLASAIESTVADANLITANGLDGINLSGTSARNVIRENIVGDADDDLLGNKRDGIGVYGVTNNGIVENLLARNARDGLMISAAVAGGIGTTNGVTGNRVVANGRNGITIHASRNQVIGGTNVGEANTIGLNKADGVFIGKLSGGVVVFGNLIGTDEGGNNLGNLGDGVEVNNSLATTIDANSISFNDGNGLRVASVRGTAVQRTLVTGNSILENDANGIQITASAATLVGGATRANVIGGNLKAGVRLDAASAGNSIEANFIGTDEEGADLGNVEDGVLITGSLGNVVNAGNTIRYNATGVRILDATATSLPQGNRVESNLVTENDADGIVIAGGAFHTVGGVGVGNTITLNGGDGVQLRTSGRNLPTGNLVQGNLIGTDVSQAPFGNVGNGVRIIGGASNTVEQNTINDNGLAGVSVGGSSMNVIGSRVVGKGNSIVGNLIGVEVTDVLDATTATTRGNVVTGNTISHSFSDGVTVGGTKTVATVIGMTSAAGVMSGRGNSIRDNAGVGIALRNAARQVGMQGNTIVDNAGGSILLDTGTNPGAATPTVTAVQLVSPSKGVKQLAVSGTLQGATAGQQYQVDVYASRPEDGNGSSYGGRFYLGRATVTAAKNGSLAYSIQVPAGASRLGDFVTVMATNLRPPSPTSSAFSAAQQIVLASPSVSNAVFAAIGTSSPTGTGTTSARIRVVR